MSSAPIGHRDMLVAKREEAIARLSPMARHQAFPTIYARPLPPADSDAELRRENRELYQNCQRLAAENDALKRQLVSAVVQANRRSEMEKIDITQKSISTGEVIRAYIAALAQVGHELDGTPYTLQDLTGPRAGRTSSWPRHVGIWLCRRLCKGASMPVLGKVFGGRDHTTVMHACARAPSCMETWPTLKAAALIVLAAFESKETTP